MNYNSKYGFGLDLGTSHSVMSVAEEGKSPQALLTMAGCQNMFNGIPSLFWCDKKGVIRLGAEAEPALYNDVANVVLSIKTKIGVYDKFTLNGRTFTTQEILLKIIENILQVSRKAAEENFIDMPSKLKMVMGIPVGFGSEKREIIMDTVKKLGCEVEFLSEPVASAIYYSQQVGENFSNVLTCDIGAGTFDTAFLTLNKHKNPEDTHPYVCIDSYGDEFAGDKIDEAIAMYILENIKIPAEMKAKAANKDHMSHRDVVIAARRIKEALTNIETHTEYFSIDEQLFKVTLSRDDLEKAAGQIFESIADKCLELAKRCKIYGKKFPILMVGGNSNLPNIYQSMAKRFPLQASKGLIQIRTPGMAVAYGCAIYARDRSVARKVNFAYGIESYVDGLNKPCIQIEIPPNAKLPFRTESGYATRFDGQKQLDFRIYELNDPPANKSHVPLGEGKNYIQVIHKFKRAVPKDTPVFCNIELSADGILDIRIRDNGITDGETVKKFNLKKDSWGEHDD